MTGALLEKKVEEIWRDYLPGRTDLVTIDNEPLEIIYPGRKNDDPGADWCGAIIDTGKGLLKGDVEIHVNSSNWEEHGHRANPNYNRVILHVVYRHDTKTGAVLQNGCKVPTLALGKYIDTPSDGKITAIIHNTVPTVTPCLRVHRIRSIPTGKILDNAGHQRFSLKVTGFREEVKRGGADQAFYHGIMNALGYSRNKEPMTKLASLVPLQNFEEANNGGMTENDYLAHVQAKLMGAAGLLPSQRGMGQAEVVTNQWVDKLEKTWTDFGKRAQMSVCDWHFFKVRPGNFPTRRIAAMSYLLLRFHKISLPAGLSEMLKEVNIDQAPQQLEESFLIPAAGYWSEYLDFGLRVRGNAPALLGKDRAADIVINVLLPFRAAMGQVNQCPEEEAKALEIYRSYPAVSENMVVKDMRHKLGIDTNIIKTVLRQQGLIHIYKTLCLTEKCRHCPLG